MALEVPVPTTGRAGVADSPVQLGEAVTRSAEGAAADELRDAARVGPGDAYAVLKPAIDALGAMALLVLLSPVLLAVAIWVAIDSPGPILYGARRVGQDGRPIRVLKFRSMHVDAEERLAKILESDDAQAAEYRETFKLKHDPRLTRAGRFIRRTSLDEFPQFINVLRGEMAMVGPRPIVELELDLYRSVPGGAEAYLACRPGITGLWQVSGRNDVTYAQRIALDIEYASSCSLAKDVEILARTPGAVLAGDGAY
jgi:exopolysaccharide production protein ExoY